MRKYQVRFGGGSVEKYLQRQLATFLPYTSLSRTNTTPARLLKIRRSHWGIETGLHGRRDVIFHEDATRMTVGNAGKVMASINNLVIALTRQAKFRNTAQARPLCDYNSETTPSNNLECKAVEKKHGTKF